MAQMGTNGDAARYSEADDDVDIGGVWSAACDEPIDLLPLDAFGAADGEFCDPLALLESSETDASIDELLRELLPNDVTSEEDAASTVRDDLRQMCDQSMETTSSTGCNAVEQGGSHAIVCAGELQRGAKPPSKDRNPTRQRAKTEIEYLRQRVHELQGELRHLQHSSKSTDQIPPVLTIECVLVGAEIEAATLAPTDGSVVETTSPLAGTTSNSNAMWRRLAERQQRLRHKAELENVKLKESLMAQLRLAQSLEKLLHKRPRLWTHDTLLSKRSCNALRRTEIIGDQENAAIFESLLAKIDQSYACYRDVLHENGLMDAPCGHRDTRLERSVFRLGHLSNEGDDDALEERVYVELTDVSDMPFGVMATCDGAWRCITSGYMQLQHDVYRGFEGANDILAVNYAVTMSRRRMHVDMTAHAVMKRFVEGDRVVFVWESISDTGGSHCASSETPGLQVEERGWTVFTSSDAGAVTQIRTCMQMSPLVVSNSFDEGRQVGFLTNFALEYFGAQLEQAHEAIESLLLDECTH
uniref:START domain-containing protein n=1 Tax=Globisporangium ultimum (strain ATCC 200006 / CBS 805.95 / DAOM BR144) TaxID=431595 RepID=K3WIW4_GLOUD